MPRTMRQEDPDAEVQKLHGLEQGEGPLKMAKAKLGEAVTEAIGDHPLKHFGHEGQLSAVCKGERVPDYLARIYQDDGARRRFGVAILKGLPNVRVRMRLVIECD